MTTTRSSNVRRHDPDDRCCSAGLTGLLVVIGALIGGPDTALLFLGRRRGHEPRRLLVQRQDRPRTARAKPISEQEAPQIYEMVRELTTAAKMPMPAIYLIPQAQPNAFATGRSPERRPLQSPPGSPSCSRRTSFAA